MVKDKQPSVNILATVLYTVFKSKHDFRVKIFFLYCYVLSCRILLCRCSEVKDVESRRIHSCPEKCGLETLVQGLDCSTVCVLFFHHFPWQSLGQILSLMCNCPCDFRGDMISLEFYTEMKLQLWKWEQWLKSTAEPHAETLNWCMESHNSNERSPVQIYFWEWYLQ